jgi:hypothetical protein
MGHNHSSSEFRSSWPDDRRTSGASYERVTSSISCVLTRFRVRSPWTLFLFFIIFRRVRKQAVSAIPGMIKAVFLVEGLRTCYTLSLWTNDNAIVDFGAQVHTHVDAANWSMRHIFRKDLGRLELWSTHWRLWAVSRNLNWDDVSLRELLTTETGDRQEDAHRRNTRSKTP